MNRMYWIAAVIFIVVAWGLSVWMFPSLPDRVPTHWNIEGKVDGFGSKHLTLWLMPGFLIGMLVIFVFLPALSPRHFEVDTFRSTYLYIMVLTMGLLTYLHGMILLATWREVSHPPSSLDIGRTLIAGIFLFLALLGNALGKVRRNFYIGIRVPWTLASDRVWNDTHRVAAWTMMLGGVAVLLSVIAGLPVVLAIAVLIASSLIPVIYSFVHYKSLERRGAL